ncbi:MAG: hypothetical protein JWP75_3302 [Frondihabitans sp.]|nr:hypothetical protein [Frondihabitans sp.]
MAGWTPARPARVTSGWRDDHQDPAVPATTQPERSRPPVTVPTRHRRRLTSPQRVLAGFVALALAIGVVTFVGVSATPSYGSLPPWQASDVADLRTLPTATGWQTDLARDVLPGVPPRCATFGASVSSGRDVILTAQSPPLGSSTSCSSALTEQVGSTVALLDLDTGRILWTSNLATSFPARVSPIDIAETFLVGSAGRALVQFVVDGQYTLASLSLASGHVLSSTSLSSDEIGIAPEIMGSLVLYGASTSREGSTSWTLADARTIDRPIWTDEIDDSAPPILTAHAVFATVSGRSIRADGTTGRVTSLGNGKVDLTSVLPEANALYAVSEVDGGIVLTAWSDAGRRLWSRSGVGTLSGVSRSCVIASLPGTTTGTCLDRTTGATRWRAPLGSGALAYGMIGQTNDDVAVYTDNATQTQIDVLDGATGRLRYSLTPPPSTYVAAVSRTVGYLVGASQTGTPTDIEAFDTASGRVLWNRLSKRPGDTQLWGGHLVTVTTRGVATELTNTPGFVLRDQG